MSKINNETMQKKLKSIHSGAFFFGIFGWGSILFSALMLAKGGFHFMTIGFTAQAQVTQDWTLAFQNLIYGWMFLKGHDAFAAIEALIREMEEIV